MVQLFCNSISCYASGILSISMIIKILADMAHIQYHRNDAHFVDLFEKKLLNCDVNKLIWH